MAQVSAGDIPSLRLLTAMAERAPTVFATTAVPSLPGLIQQVCSTCLTNNTTNNSTPILEALMQVLVQAATATQQQQTTTTAILPFASQPVDTVDPQSPAAELGRTCLPVLMEHLSASLLLSSNHHTSVLEILQQWTNAATQCPSLLAGTKELLEAVVSACLVVANNTNNNNNNNDEATTAALAALEVLSSLCAVGDVKRKILAVDPALCQTLVQGKYPQQNQLGVIALTAQFMTSGVDDDVEDWASEPASLLEDDQWEGDDNACYAESLFQSFLHSLAGPALAVALPLVESLLQNSNSNDWKRQRAGLSMMEACLTSAPVSFTPHAPVAMEAALGLATAAQPLRVQWQALRLLGVLCETDVTLEQTTVRQHYCLRILQCLSQAVQSPCSKVSSLACLAIVSFCRGGAAAGKGISNDDSPHPVTQYLSDLLQSLVAGPLSLDVSNRGAVVVKIRAIGAVACLAEASGEAFAPFYASIMPGLLTCSQMQHRGSHEMTQLIGAAIESATIVGQATEADETTRAHYVTDAQQIMNLIVPMLQQAEAGTSDMPVDQILSACARIAVVMGPDYSPYVQLVLPHLINRATAPPDVSVTVRFCAGVFTIWLRPLSSSLLTNYCLFIAGRR